MQYWGKLGGGTTWYGGRFWCIMVNCTVKNNKTINFKTLPQAGNCKLLIFLSFFNLKGNLKIFFMIILLLRPLFQRGGWVLVRNFFYLSREGDTPYRQSPERSNESFLLYLPKAVMRFTEM